MRGRILFLLSALFASTFFAEAQQATSAFANVDDLVRAGIASNKDLASIRERIAEAKGRVRQAGVRPAPTLTLNGVTGKPLGTEGEEQYGAELSQSVETFGKRGKRIRVAELSVKVSEEELRDRSVQLAFEIKAAYAEVLAERHKLKVFNDLIEINQESLKLTEARVKEGDVAPLEANLIKVEISRAQVLQVSAQGRLVSAETELRRLVGINRNIPIPNEDFPDSRPLELSALQQKALQDRADLAIAEAAEEQETMGIRLARAEAKPDVTLSTSFSRQNSQFEGLYGFTNSGALTPIRERADLLNFGVSLPLRTTRSGAGNIQAATARTAGARAHREYLQQTIPLDVESAYRRWIAAKNSLEMLQSGVISPSTANLSVIREAYKLGQLRLLDVLNEQRRLLDTQLAYIDAQADANRTLAELERATGGNL